MPDYDKAHYLMSTGNTLLVTGSIFILAFITALTIVETRSINSDVMNAVLLGGIPVGFLALIMGLYYYYKAQYVAEEKKIVGLGELLADIARRPVDAFVRAVLVTAPFLWFNHAFTGEWMPKNETIAAIVVTLGSVIILRMQAQIDARKMPELKGKRQY